MWIQTIIALFLYYRTRAVQFFSLKREPTFLGMIWGFQKRCRFISSPCPNMEARHFCHYLLFVHIIILVKTTIMCTYEVGYICPKMQHSYLCVNCTFDCLGNIVHVIWVVIIITLPYVEYNLTLQQYMQNT